MRILYILLLLSLFSANALAQFNIRGTVTFADGSGVPFANVMFKSNSNELFTGVITDELGQFEVILAVDSYSLTVSYVGYESHTQQVDLIKESNLGKIVLIPRVTELENVVIFGKKPLIVRKIDRLIFNVEQNPIMIGADATEVLKKAPGIIFKDGQFSMIGKSGMRVMIDGRPLELTGQEIASFLSTMPIDRIKEVEIITNPSAKYDAQGNSGIINIITKKGQQNAWSNRTSYVYNQAFFSNHRLSNTFIYNKGKVGLVLGLNGKGGHTRIIKKSNIYYSSGTWSIKEYEKVNDANFAANLDLNYQIDDYNNIGAKYLRSAISPDATSDAETRVFNQFQNLRYILQNDAAYDRKVAHNSYNLYYERKLDTLGTSVSLNLDYFNFDSDIFGTVTTGKSENGLPVGVVFSNKIKTDQQINNYSIKVDVTHPTKLALISYGGRLSFISTNYLTANYNTITGERVFDEQQSNEFSYDEDVQALYINGTRSLNDRWEMQFGLRLENTRTKGVSKQNSQTNERKFLYLFPTFYLSHQFDEKNSLNLTYGRRLDRPNFGLLNPARKYSNSNAYSEGNPFLQPEITNNFELNHSYDDQFTTSLFLTKTVNGYGIVTNVNDQNNVQITTFKNYYNNYSYGLSESYSFNKVLWLESQLNIYLVNSESKFYEDAITADVKNGIQFFFIANNTLSLSKEKGIKGQADFMYTAPYNEGLYSLAKSYSLDLGMSFESLFKNLDLSITVADIFNSSRNLATSKIDNVIQDFNVFPSNRFFRATISYSFGNNNIKSKEREFGNDEEKRRSN